MVDVADADVVAVLTRAPTSGGKSRLFAALGRPFDPALLRALLLDTVDGVATPGVAVVVAVTPPDACHEIVRLQTEVAHVLHVVPQPEGDLGARMAGTMRELFAAGARRVLLVGSDLPSIAPTLIRAAFDLLDRDPAALVLGPAADGGYYLIGATGVPPVFDGIEWGSGAVLAQTRAAAERAGLHVNVIDTLADVDTVADLQRLAGSPSRTGAWASMNGITSARGSVT